MCTSTVYVVGRPVGYRRPSTRNSAGLFIRLGRRRPLFLRPGPQAGLAGVMPGGADP